MCRIWVVYYPWKKKVCENLRLTRHLFKLFVLVIVEGNFSNLKESCRFGWYAVTESKIFQRNFVKSQKPCEFKV